MKNHYIHSVSILFSVFFLSFSFIQNSNAQDAAAELNIKKQTSLALYVTSVEAFEKWKNAPELVNILDVRTPEEYLFIGHAPMAYNIPLATQTYKWNSENQGLTMELHKNFVAQVKRVFQLTDTILVTCRSGGRSAMAINLLAEEGYLYVFNITDGFEGDMVKNEGSLYYEKRMVNGWKNSGLPWTYDLHKDLMVLPKK